MKTIIIGLGNPGEKFNHTRHNAGFEALDFFAQKNSFPDFSPQKKYHSLISEKEDVILVKPQTFMNESGSAVKSFKFQVSSLIVIHDDMDLPLGTLKISKDSGPGGHKGVASIIEALGTKDFTRIKIGVATDGQKAEDVVLKKFTSQEQEILETIINKTSEALTVIMDKGLEKAMNQYN